MNDHKINDIIKNPANHTALELKLAAQVRIARDRTQEAEDKLDYWRQFDGVLLSLAKAVRVKGFFESRRVLKELSRKAHDLYFDEPKES